MEDNSLIMIPTIAGAYYEENECYTATELIATPHERHTILWGMKYTYTMMGDVWVDSNSHNNDAIMERLTGENNWLRENAERDRIGIYLQDIFQITDLLSLTTGLRYDHYENRDPRVGQYDHATPRVSGVYNFSDHHIFKLQYSAGIRPPTFSELYSQANTLFRGNPELTPEHINCWELGYTSRYSNATYRVTLFHSELKDKIDYPDYADPLSLGQGDITYRNIDDKILTRGFELEMDYDLMPQLNLNMNLSYADTKTPQDEPISGSTKWLGNAGLLYSWQKKHDLALQYRFLGKRYRPLEDPREDLDPFHTLNLTMSTRDLFTNGLTLRVGVRNIFDASLRDPAPVFEDYLGNISYTYQDDFPRQGREFWLECTIAFKDAI